VHRWLLTVGSVEVIDVCIPERTASHGITANTNATDSPNSAEPQQNDKTSGHLPRHGSDHVENLKEHRLGDGRIEFADIEGSRRRRARRSGRMIRGNRGRSGGRRGSRNRRLGGGLGRDLWSSGGRHLAGVFRLAFFLFDKVVTAGKLFYDWARCNRGEHAKKNRAEMMTRTQKATP